MTETLQIYNPPFDVSYSSCSTICPSLFNWRAYSTVEDPVVVCDNYIPHGIKLNQKKYAWLVESPALLGNLVQYIKVNRKLISYSYSALYTCIDELVGLEPNFIYCPAGSNLPWIKKREIPVKEKLCSMFASRKRYAPGHFLRNEIAEKYQGKIDLFGGTLDSQKLGEGIHPDKSQGMFPYMFSIVIENCKVDKYYTEKITDCFATGTIPIYWGTDRIVEDFDENGIIFLDDKFDINCLTPDLYFSKMQAIMNNLEHVNTLKMADDSLFELIKRTR
jgi:hypothetical protein